MIVSCDDDEIILTLDGDDWLAHINVLNKLNDVYCDENVWMTYGQYRNYPGSEIGIAKQIPSEVIANNSFRQYDWCSSHLRTFYTWLFKQIKVDDLKYDGKFMTSAWDATIMYPQLEMAGMHSKFISDVLYIYNLENPLNDHKVDVAIQQWFDHYCRTMPKYTTCQKPALNRTKVGLMLIATGKYDQFLQGMISSADNFFLKDCEVTYYVFGDKAPAVRSVRNVIYIPIEHKPFPFASMDRYKYFTKNADKLSKEQYLFFSDVDALFVDNVIKSDIIGNLVGTRHCGYIDKPGTFEDNPQSCLYLGLDQYKYYFAGGFNGGSSSEYLRMANWCYEMIEKDLANGIIPRWHDESALNSFFAYNIPDKILTPSFHYPRSNIEAYKRGWLPDVYYPKLLLLDKDHESIRK